MQQMAAEKPPGKMTSDMDMHMKESCVIEFLHAEKMAPTDNSGSSPVVQILTGAACRLLFVAGENA